MLSKNTDFENLKKHQKGFIQGVINERIERDELLEPIRDYYNNTYISEYYIITPEIIIAQQKSPFKDDEEEYIYEAFVDGKKVLETSTYTLEGAIILGLAAKNGDAGAGVYAARALGLKKF